MIGGGEAVKERFAKYPLQGNVCGLTMFEVAHVYQLAPPPPESTLLLRRRGMTFVSSPTSCTTLNLV